MTRTTPYNKRTILPNGEGQIDGRKGELLFADYLTEKGLEFEDIGHKMKLTDFIVNGVKIDVKIKRRNVPARMEYDAHVQTCQRYPNFGDELYDPDVYVFGTSYKGEISLLCWCVKRWFWQNCQIVKKGDPDGNNYKELDDAGKIQYSKMHSMASLWPVLHDMKQYER